MKALVEKFRSVHVVLLALAAGVLGCDSTGVGNPYEEDEPGTLALAIVADEEASPSDDETSLPPSGLEHAVLVLGSVTWLPCRGDVDLPIVQEGPFVIDLMTGETEPELPVFRAPAGGMCELEAALAPARDSAALGARSIYFAGTRADGVEFVLFADVRATLRVRVSSTEVKWGTNDNRRLLWAMRPRRWAARMELDSAEPRSWNGGRRRTIVIDANRHPLLLSLIRSRLASESTIFSDESPDRRLDTAERRTQPIGTGSTDSDD